MIKDLTFDNAGPTAATGKKEIMDYRIGDGHRTIMGKLGILTDAAKYDVACTSSGSDRRGDGKGIGNAISAGICHSFSGDGRCISLLKILFTNECIYDCKY